MFQLKIDSSLSGWKNDLFDFGGPRYFIDFGNILLKRE